MTKQMRDTVILSVALVILVAVAISQFSKMGGPKPTPKKQNTQQAATPKGPDAAAKADTGFPINDKRVPKIVAEVKGGRNPFANLMYRESSGPVDPPVQRPRGGEISGGDLGDDGSQQFEYPDEPQLNSFERTLAWTTPEKVANAMAAAKLDVEFKVLNSEEQRVKLVGYDPDFTRARDILTGMDRTPDAPNFKLLGIVTTSSERFASLTLDGEYYTLSKGETVPLLGWTVTNITPTEVTLSKGKQQLTLKVMGG